MKMNYYTILENDNLLTAQNEEALTRFYDDVRALPIDYEQDKYIAQNGVLILNPDWEELNLTNAKNKKIKQNDIARDEALLQGVEYKDVLFDSDTDQKVNLLATVSMMNDEDVITWYGMDNQPLECNKEDLLNIGGLITALHSFCWNKNAEIKEEINEAETVEEVKAIIIDYRMPKEESEIL